MKIQTNIICLILAVSLPAQCQENPEAQITFRVIDDLGEPVPNATVGMATFVRWQPGDNFGTDLHDGPKGITDKNGVVKLSCLSKTGQFGYRVRDLNGYYRDQGDDFRFQNVKDRRWQPWNPTIEIELKKIANPIAMYTRKVQKEIPQATGPVGFDLEAGDWVTPYGKGGTNDILFTLKRQFADRRNYEASMTITFPNKGDGFVVTNTKKNYKGSELKLPRTAPDNGYEPKLVASVGASENDPGHEGASANNSFFFRVGTVLDDDEKVKSALYGKIDGGFHLDAINSKTSFVLFTYYLNPTANDRNMEFNPQKNLSANLTSDEQVTAP